MVLLSIATKKENSNEHLLKTDIFTTSIDLVE
jgi:hypothetical protein